MPIPEHIPEQFTADLATSTSTTRCAGRTCTGTENTRPAIARNFVVATVAPPTKQAEVAAEATAAAAATAPAAAPARRQRHRRAAAPARRG